jgi:hypothetical protein
VNINPTSAEAFLIDFLDDRVLKDEIILVDVKENGKFLKKAKIFLLCYSTLFSS